MIRDFQFSVHLNGLGGLPGMSLLYPSLFPLLFCLLFALRHTSVSPSMSPIFSELCRLLFHLLFPLLLNIKGCSREQAIPAID